MHRASAWFPAADGPRVESSDPFFPVQTFVDNAKSSRAMQKQLYHFIEHCVAIGGVDNAVVLRECLVVEEGLPGDLKVLIGAGKPAFRWRTWRPASDPIEVPPRWQK